MFLYVTTFCRRILSIGHHTQTDAWHHNSQHGCRDNVDASVHLCDSMHGTAHGRVFATCTSAKTSRRHTEVRTSTRNTCTRNLLRPSTATAIFESEPFQCVRVRDFIWCRYGRAVTGRVFLQGTIKQLLTSAHTCICVSCTCKKGVLMAHVHLHMRGATLCVNVRCNLCAPVSI